MRCGLRGLSVILDNNDEFVAISLGSDFTAEHEWGITELHAKFKTKGFGKKVIYGLESDLITKPSIHSYNLTEGDDNFFIITSCSYPIRAVSNYKDNLLQFRTSRNDVIDMWSAWDQNDFILIFKESHAAKKICESIIKCFKHKDIVLTLLRMEPLTLGSGLHIVRYSKIPKAIIEDKIKKIKHMYTIKRTFESHPAVIKLEKARKNWCKHYNVSSTPFDSFALVPKGDSVDTISIWLNPKNQAHLNSGWISFKDIEDWVEGLPGAVIKSREHWEELKYMCAHKGYPIHSIAYNLPFFIGKCDLETEHPNDMSVQLEPCVKGKLPKYTLKLIASIVKREVQSDIRTQLLRTPFSEINNISRQCEEYLHGFFNALTLSGYGYYGASNTPVEYENVCWFRDLLIDEAFWDVMVERGEAYEPWVKNKNTLYHGKKKKINYLY